MKDSSTPSHSGSAECVSTRRAGIGDYTPGARRGHEHGFGFEIGGCGGRVRCHRQCDRSSSEETDNGYAQIPQGLTSMA